MAAEPELERERAEADRFTALSPERKADELNRMVKESGVPDVYVVVRGQVVREGSVNYMRSHAAGHALIWSRRSWLAAIVRHVRTRGRARRGRRATLRRTPARSPGRQADDEPDLAELEAAA